MISGDQLARSFKLNKGLVPYEDIETLILQSIGEMDWLFYKVLHKLFHLEIPDFLGREGVKKFTTPKLNAPLKSGKETGWSWLDTNIYLSSLPSYPLRER